ELSSASVDTSPRDMRGSGATCAPIRRSCWPPTCSRGLACASRPRVVDDRENPTSRRRGGRRMRRFGRSMAMVFISHAHADELLARKISALLGDAVGLAPGDFFL